MEYLKLLTSHWPGMLVVFDAIVSSAAWLQVDAKILKTEVRSPSTILGRIILTLVGGLLIITGVVYSSRSQNEDNTTDTPILSYYFCYISLEDYEPKTETKTCRARFHVAFRLEAPNATTLKYVDRVKTGGAIEYLQTVPAHRVLNPEQYPNNPTLLQFDIQPKNSNDRALDVEAITSVLTKMTEKMGKIGPNIPYDAKNVVVIVDYSKLKFRPKGALIAKLEAELQDGVSQSGDKAPIVHEWENNTVTLVARGVKAKSSVLLTWGTEIPQQ